MMPAPRVALLAPSDTIPVMAGIESGLRKAGLNCTVYVGPSPPPPTNVSDVEILVPIVVPCPADLIGAMPSLRAIVTPLLGYDFIDVSAATARNVAVVNGEVPENRAQIAEATIMLLLACLYRLKETEAALRQGEWGRPIHRSMLQHRKVGIIGYGGITRAIIERLGPWRCDLQVYSSAKALAPDSGAVSLVSLDELLASSDAVVVMTAMAPGKRHLLGRSELARMKPGAVIVNTARGGLVAEDDLHEALRSGHISAAALDVFEHEPLSADHPLRSHSNVILTPHAIGHTRDGSEAVIARAIANILAVAGGELPDSCRNPEIRATWGKGQPWP